MADILYAIFGFCFGWAVGYMAFGLVVRQPNPDTYEDDN